MLLNDKKNLKTERLILTEFAKSDTDYFAKINADKEVMRFFDQTMTYQETLASVESFFKHIEKYGYGLWSVWNKKNNQWLGVIMLLHKDEKSGLPNVPLVEIGWVFKKETWGNGYATESAKAVIDYAFSYTDIETIYAHTTIANKASIRVMQKVGFINQNRDFIHPLVDKESGLNKWCVCCIAKKYWENKQLNSRN